MSAIDGIDAEIAALEARAKALRRAEALAILRSEAAS